MDDNELIRSAFALLDEGHFDAAEARFGEYMGRRAPVLGDAQLRALWNGSVAARRAEAEARKSDKREQEARQPGRRRWGLGVRSLQGR